MPETKSPTELTDLDVDRVDAVDRPATRRKFLITKAEGDPETKPAGERDAASEAMRLLRAATAAVKAIHKAAPTHVDQGVVDVFNELAIASGESVRFAKAEAEPAAAVAAATPAPAAVAAPATTAPAATTEVAKTEPVTAIDIAALAEAIGTSVVKALKADIDAATEPLGQTDPKLATTPPASAQPTAVAKRAPAEQGLGFGSWLAGA